jgi:UDP:flavonoid glycosyltransferase YjiC (YdhE family)
VLRAAVASVLGAPAHREAAARVRASFTAAGGAPAAADRLEGLLAPAATPGAGRALTEPGGTGGRRPGR